jgi:hypothetical protein
MRYTWYQRGKCKYCENILWTNHKINSVVCKCGKASILIDKKKNIKKISNEEHLIEIRKEFWWLSGETIDTTIDLLRGK